MLCTNRSSVWNFINKNIFEWFFIQWYIIKIKIISFNYVIEIIRNAVFKINFFQINNFLLLWYYCFIFYSISCIIVITTNRNDNYQIKQIIVSKILWKRKSILSHVTFSLSSEILVVVSISPSHANTNLSIRRFSQEQLLVSWFPTLFHVLLHSQSQVLGFQI